MWVEYTSAAALTLLLPPSPIDGSSMKIIDGSLCHGCKREQEVNVIDGSCNGLDKMGYCDKGSSDLHFPLPSLSFVSLCYYENARMDMRKAKGEESIAKDLGKVQDGRCNLPVFILRHLNEASRVRAFISASVTPTLKQQQQQQQREEEKKMIEVVLNDRLGKKVRVKCNEDDTIGDLKKLVAAQTGTRADKIRIQKWYNVYKDHITLKDYEIHDGMGLELYYN
ncbi:hypothetical protein TEA_024217 [Camellia sinensis var. sinensis]|uniref:Ubiquitin-like domain-containing protein n=3 Tax=Pentapetalae TaxID=1437201 RepID=A0A4S4DXN3_CAMSN|nr:hypothetical protein TEA_024217 [Camellia sinensis var. sinensis]